MKLLSSGSHNIAWFKLAEFVTRGEKERALNVYKLLMHSVPDQAFAHQLEGDILAAFDDAAALDRYHNAANLYKKQKNYKKAIAVYEHVASTKQDLNTFQALIDIYDHVQDYTNMIHSFARFAYIAVKNKHISVLIDRLHAYSAISSINVQADLYSYTCFALLAYDRSNSFLELYLEQTVDLYLQVDNLHALDKFMAKLKVLDEDYHSKTQNFLCKVKN